MPNDVIPSASIPGISGKPIGVSKARGAPQQSKQDLLEVELLIAKLRGAAAIHAERVSAVADGALLGVEQVQEIRLRLIENPPGVTIEDVFFDVLVSLTLMGVGAALVPVIRSIAKESTALIGWELAKRPKLSAAALRRLNGGGVIANKIEQELLKSGQTSDLTPRLLRLFNAKFRDDFQHSIETQLTTTTDRVSKLAIGIKEPTKAGILMDVLYSEQYRLDPADAPSVELLGAAQSYASTQRAAIARNAATVESWIRGGVLSQEDLAQVASATSFSELDVGADSIRRQQKMFTEAVLWLRLHSLESGKISADSFGRLKIGSLPKELQQYVVNRFYRAALVWAIKSNVNTRQPKEANGINLTLFGTPIIENSYMTDFKPKQDSEVAYSDKTSLVNRMFVELGSNYQKTLKDMGPVPGDESGVKVSDGVVTNQRG